MFRRRRFPAPFNFDNIFIATVRIVVYNINGCDGCRIKAFSL